MPRDKVLSRIGVVREKIIIFLKYTTFMRGTDVTNQLQASYSSQNRSQKWWHQVFLASGLSYMTDGGENLSYNDVMDGRTVGYVH
jgi:hypothetical protein